MKKQTPPKPQPEASKHSDLKRGEYKSYGIELVVVDVIHDLTALGVHDLAVLTPEQLLNSCIPLEEDDRG